MQPVDPKFSDDFHKFVLQDQALRPLVNPLAKPVKPFKIEPAKKSKKPKKDIKKEDNPFNLKNAGPDPEDS